MTFAGAPNGLSTEEAKTSLRQAFVRKAFAQAPLFAFEYDDAEIDWTTGFPEKRIAFARRSYVPILIAISLRITRLHSHFHIPGRP
jgi:hypothetical protein